MESHISEDCSEETVQPPVGYVLARSWDVDGLSSKEQLLGETWNEVVYATLTEARDELRTANGLDEDANERPGAFHIYELWWVE